MACQFCTLAAMADIGDGAVLTIVGMLVVFATLAGLGILIAVLGRWLKAHRHPIEQGDTGRAPTAGGVDPRILAVLAAAATAATMKPVRLKQVTPLGDKAATARK